MNEIKKHNGITLIALIITIIVMLILVAVSVTIAIKGDLFGATKRAAKGTEREINAEQQLANGRVKIDDTWYDSLEDYVGGKPSKDQNESNINFTHEPKGWTNGPVKVKIEAQGIEGTLQYSMDEITWTNYTGEAIEVENNGTRIYARVMGSEEEVETVIEKIDKEDPSITVALNSPSQTTTSINIEIGAKDSISGISKIEWYYKNSSETEDKYTKLTEDKYAEINGENAGNKNEIKAEKTISGLEKGTTYNIKVVIYDVAGNKTESTVEAQTIASLLGKSATINGRKYKVLYEPGEKIQIGDTEYEIKDAQLISTNVLAVGQVTLGYQDGQIDWENTDVIAEADINKNNTLEDVEKAIYSYNHVVETLNNKCANLVGNTNPDIVSVRSVGSNPINPEDTSTFYESNLLAKYPSWAPGRYNRIGKSGDENYLTDWNRMAELKIRTTGSYYWLASRKIEVFEDGYWFEFRTVNTEGGDYYVVPWAFDTDGASNRGQDSAGVRPVVSLQANALAKYLD